MVNIFYGWWVVLACFAVGLYVSSGIFFGFTAFIDPLVKEFPLLPACAVWRWGFLPL